MACIRPFRGIFYSTKKIDNLADVTMPPFDVISKQEQDSAYERHPQNIIRLILDRKTEADTAENNPYTRAAASLAQWLQEFVGNYLKDLNRPADITIDCQYKDLLIEFDPENLQRVMGNLLDNGLRHSKKATGKETARIIVGIDFASHQCLLDVIDSGAGVPLSDQPKLFEPFFTTVAEGSGMGLYLCKELCEINNANLSYQPTTKGESCFRISMNQLAS